jgi:hypothetical protein
MTNAELRDEVIRELRRRMLDNLEWRFGNLEQQVANLNVRLLAIEAKRNEP